MMKNKLTKRKSTSANVDRSRKQCKYSLNFMIMTLF